MDAKIGQKMHKLANAYANDETDQKLDQLEAKMKNSEGTFTYSREAIKKTIGQMLAIAYAKGYADSVENVELVRMIF
jgi:predicted DNA-binding protein